jgi:hypothetical protein
LGWITFSNIKTCSRNHKKKKKVIFIFHPYFYFGSGMKNVRIRIRDGKIFGSGTGIKHTGSATLYRSLGLFPRWTRTVTGFVKVSYCSEQNKRTVHYHNNSTYQYSIPVTVWDN